MTTQNLPFTEADITERDSFGLGDVIAYELPATVVRPYGLASIVWKTYPYARVERRSLSYTNRAIIRDRATPGDVVMKIAPEPSNHLMSDPSLIFQPTMAALITAFGAGGPIETNVIAQQQVQTSADSHYVSNITLDTAQNRLFWLKICLTKLGNEIVKIPTVSRLVLPYGIGATPDTMDRWYADVAPLIMSLRAALMKHGKEVVMLRRPVGNAPMSVPLPFDDPRGNSDSKIILLDNDLEAGVVLEATTSTSPPPPPTPIKRKHHQQQLQHDYSPNTSTTTTTAPTTTTPHTGSVKRRVDSNLDAESQEVFFVSSSPKKPLKN